jgi:pyruvate,orthophosphate dikinase
MSKLSGNRVFALDLYRTFLYDFGTKIIRIDRRRYDDIANQVMLEHGIKNEEDITEAALDEIVLQYKLIVDIPTDPYVQLNMAIESMMDSWRCRR